jgi:hypothetical protein
VPHRRQASVTSSKSSASGVGSTETAWSGFPQQGQGTTIDDDLIGATQWNGM